jgi:transposase
VTPGEAPEVKRYDALMGLHDTDPDRLLGDKGYDGDEIRNDLTERGIEPVIPQRSNRKTPIEYDRQAYKRRNLIERCVNRSSNFVASPRATRKPPEPTFRCYVLRPPRLAQNRQHGRISGYPVHSQRRRRIEFSVHTVIISSVIVESSVWLLVVPTNPTGDRR